MLCDVCDGILWWHLSAEVVEVVKPIIAHSDLTLFFSLPNFIHNFSVFDYPKSQHTQHFSVSLYSFLWMWFGLVGCVMILKRHDDDEGSSR